MKNYLFVCALAFVCGCGGNTGGNGNSGGAGSAGTGGTGGSGTGGSGGGVGGGSGGGSGGTIPSTALANKVDLLVMVDNSISMADKQAVLIEALPGLVNALTTPPTDSNGQALYAPVNDIHFGVITSSLGGHGGDICAPGAGFNETQNDKAHLVGSLRPGLSSYQSQGFLWWDPTQQFGGEADPNALVSNFQSHIQGAGEQGCGYEASLESWYRFLIDPAPPQTVSQVNGATVVEGTDDVLLQQRKDFLRPDSLVIIVMLSDENDCSMKDSEQNWIFAQASGGSGQFYMPRATSACESDPGSVCCRSCAETESAPPAGCAALGQDASCQLGSYDGMGDHLNLRCWQQERRFGLTNLHPTRRYVDALTKSVIEDREGNLVANPLFLDSSTGQIGRALNNVLFVPIVGVPWQDVATPDSLTGTGLTYLTAQEIAAQGRWDWLVPQCKSLGADGVCDAWDLTDQPDDPLMIESTAARTGVNPATGAALAPSSAGVGANPINGHEFDSYDNSDLQYACTFELPEPRDCATIPPGTGCDCMDFNVADKKSPLCQAPDGSYSSVQRHAKAYPGTRQLQVAKDLGGNSVVGSACPKSLGPTNPTHAYAPVVEAVARQLAGRLVK